MKAQKFFDSFPNSSSYFDKEKMGELSKEKRGVNSQSAVHTSSGQFSSAFGPHPTKGGPGGSKGTAQHFTTSGLNRKRKFTRYLYYIFFYWKDILLKISASLNHTKLTGEQLKIHLYQRVAIIA